ncbi:tetratricopeptide repeat protein [Streptomyces sp. NPDC059142]|uniref:AfsR/SARP family transcriptional regulator n=1 Tax=Streptomyces sp. NPDC059142 TaxID=3346739 RepID=UPI0036C48F06
MGLRLDGQRLELGSDKERAVLAALALDAGRPVSIDRLMGRLWDTAPPENARANTHTYVSRLRRHLRRAGDGPGAPRIHTRAHTYVLEVDAQHIDWFRFQRLVARAATSVTGGDDEQALSLLTGAEQLWQGEALAGLPGEWAMSVRRTLAERRLAATVSRNAAALRTGRFTDLADELPALAEEHPGDEAIAAQLMLARYGCGRYTEALRVHERIRRLLVSEYGSRPGAELNRIHRGILERVAPGELVRSVLGTPGNGHTPGRTTGTRPGGARADKAPSALRSSSTAASAPAPDSDAAPGSGPDSAPAPSPPSQPLPPRNLPHQSPLVGRGQELRALSALADTAATDASVITLETVSGMAGVGKTAVALHTARHLAPRFPDGQIYLDLRAHSSVQEPLAPDAALATLLRLFGTPAETIPMGLAERTALWRSTLAERRAVIVLDDAAGAAQVTPLLAGESGSLTIITSRRHLAGLPYARSIPLDVLPTGDAITLFRRFAGEDRTQDIQEVARIVRLCGYLPLAIELVAHRFRVRSSWTLATLRERLARPSGRLGEIRDGEQEVARAFDLSYRTLPDAQRVAFRRLGLHPGADFTADAAAALLNLSRDAVERLLEALLASHLLREPTPDRYEYHDLVHEFARTLAMSEDGEQQCEEAVSRVIHFYVDAADAADRLVYPRRIRPEPGSRGSVVQLPQWPAAEDAKSWFTAERGNLLAAENYARTHGHPEQAAQLAYEAGGFLEGDCHWQDAVSILRHAVAHWSRTGERPALCRALLCLGAVQANTGHYPEAARTGEQALELARGIGDADAEAEAYRTLGALNWHLGENRRALVLFQNSFAVKSQTGDAWDRARGYNNIAVCLLHLGEHSRALEHFRNALDAFTEADDRVAMGKTFTNMGNLYLHAGEMALARHSFERSISLLDPIGNRYDRATARGNLANVLVVAGEMDAALPLYREAIDEFRSLGDRKSLADVLIGVGEAHRKAGDPEKAAGFHRDALRIAEAIGAAGQETRALRLLGLAYFETRSLGPAADQLRAALLTALRTHDADEEVKSRCLLAEVRLAAGDADEARSLLRQALDSAARLPDSQVTNRISNRLLEVAKEIGQADDR